MPDPSRLIVLEKARLLLRKLNDAVARMRQSHLLELKRQLMKSALSVVSNIAEGRKKQSQREFLRFLDIARASNGELEEQIKSAGDCRAMPELEQAELAKRADEVGKMLTGLIKKIKDDLNDLDDLDDEKR